MPAVRTHNRVITLGHFPRKPDHFAFVPTAKKLIKVLICIFIYSLIDFNTRNRRETEAETTRIRTSQTAAERALESREKSHRSRVKSLEEQVIYHIHPSQI
jgi:hypothetical protein